MYDNQDPRMLQDKSDKQMGEVGKLAESAVESISRRDVLRKIVIATGVVATSNFLPEKWVKPVVEAGVLPVHAQTSPGSAPTIIDGCAATTGTFNVVMTWDTDTDVELHVFEACTFIDVAPKGFGGPLGSSIQHLGDDQGGTGQSSETIAQITNGVILEGTYNVHVGGATGVTPMTVTVMVTTDQGTQTFQRTLNAFEYVGVANITFPGGQIEETTGFKVEKGGGH